jgi:hypothetical protein
MYHVFGYYRHDNGYEYRGSAETLEDAAKLVRDEFADLFETLPTGALKEIAYWTERGEMLGNGRQKKQIGWEMLDDESFYLTSEWTEKWVENDWQSTLSGLGLKPGQGVTGYFPPGQWVRE